MLHASQLNVSLHRAMHYATEQL